MIFSKVITFLALILLCQSALIYIPNLQIDPILIYQTQVACNRLQNNLRATYGTASESAITYYSQVYAANYFLQQLSKSDQLKPYLNTIVGGNNTVSGVSNLIIGNSNMVLGSGNYVFSQGFNSTQSGVTDNNLVLDEWLIKLAMLQGVNNFLAYMANPHGSIAKW